MWKHCTFYCSLYDLFLNYEEELLDIRSLAMKMKVNRKEMSHHPWKVKRVYPECRYRFLMKLKHVSTSKNETTDK